MGNRKGMIYATLERLDALMAIGSGRIHSSQMRTISQQHVMTFLRWARETYGINRLERLEERADELASAYLSERVQQDDSPWTLLTKRSALRFFFSHPELAAEVDLPHRTREDSTRSHLPDARDQALPPDEHWYPLIDFILATGLCREEVRDLRVRDIFCDEQGRLVVEVVHREEGKRRVVPVFPGREVAVLCEAEGREAEAPVFEHLPDSLDIHALRRQFAQELYMHYSGRPLPLPEGRLHAEEVDREAVRRVSLALGHHRIDTILPYSLR